MPARPPRARGLKLRQNIMAFFVWVAPPAGAWIETYAEDYLRMVTFRRAPRGRVD